MPQLGIGQSVAKVRGFFSNLISSVKLPTSILLFFNFIQSRLAWTTRQNLLTYSEDFSNAAWTKSNGTATGGQTGYDGSNNAFSFISNTANAGHRVIQSATANGSNTISIYAKANGYDYLAVYEANNGAGRFFNLSNGTIGNAMLLTPSDSIIEDVGNGWYKLTIVLSSNTTSVEFWLSADGINYIFTGDGISGVFIQQAQLNEGATADEYVKTEAEPYSFAGDETQLNDYSGSNNGGRIHSGGALSFDGVNDLVEPSYEIGGTFTVCGWVNFTSKVGTNVFVSSQETLNDDGMSLALSNDVFFVKVNTGVALATGTANGKYSHFVGSWDGTTIKGYIDGVEVCSAAYSGTLNTNQTQIGKAPFALAWGLMELAETQIYNRALSATEVLYNYNNQQTPIQNGLVVNYGFDELAGTTLFDKSGNGNNGTIVGATWESGIKEGFQPALSGYNNYSVFDSTDPSYVDIGSNLFNGLSAFDVTIKVNVADYSNVPFLLSCGSTVSNGIHWYVNSGQEELRININGTTYDVNYPIIENEIFEGRFVLSGGNLEWYKDDVLIATSTSIPTIVASGSNTRIAAPSYSTSASLNGIIDYVEIEGLHRWSNLGGWVDEIGANNGTENGTPSKARIFGAEYNSATDVFSNAMVNPFYQGALNFSGGYPNLYIDAGANVDTSGAFSFAGWVYLESNGANQFIFANRQGLAGITFFINDLGSTYTFNALNDDGTIETTTTSAAVSYSERFFLVYSRSATGQTNFYIGNKTTAPTLSGTANQAGGTPTAGTFNMTFYNRPIILGFPADIVSIYELMYAEDWSSANTDLTKINQIWNATKGSIPT